MPQQVNKLVTEKKYLSTSSHQTPKEKFDLKQYAIKNWEEKVKEKNSLFHNNELYSFTIYTAYTQTSKEGNKLRLNTEDTADWSNGTAIDLAIPEQVLFSASEAPIHPYDLTYPKYSVRNNGNDHRDSSQILSLLADYYGDQKSGSSKKIYSYSQHTNNWNLISKGEKTIANGNKTTLGKIPKTIGIFIDIPQWYEDEKSAMRIRHFPITNSGLSITPILIHPITGIMACPISSCGVSDQFRPSSPDRITP